MKIRQAQSYQSAALAVASNSCLNRSGLYILKSPKFEITKTLIYYYKGGLAKTYYINKDDNLVYTTGSGLRKDVLEIGEVEEIAEMPVVIFPWGESKFC